MGSQDVVLYRTDDGGANWAPLAAGYPEEAAKPGAVSPSGLPFEGMKSGLRFADPQNGWLTGLTHWNSIWLYASRDGGNIWQWRSLAAPQGYPTVGGSVDTQPPLFFGSQNGLLPVQFHDEGQPTIFYVTHDGGSTWSPTTAIRSSVGSCFVWSWLDVKRGWATDGDKIYATRDGGQAWQEITPNVSLKGAWQLDFVSEQTGWAICEGRLLRTADGGHTWLAANP